jgi:superfamily I DNA/RNA helicase
MPTQAEERTRYLNLVLDSTATKKLIVAGPGTGKTYAFKEILRKLGPGNYLILSFIRKLVDELASEIGDTAEVKTFHAFCKGILHEVQGIVDIYPKLPQIIQKDAELLGFTFSDFETKFRNLNEESPDIKFFLKRGDYYQYLSFDDSVYRLYQLLKLDNSILENYDHIIVDEYQDFNKLEVEFIKELEKKGSVLIVGDDDQAIYEGRSSSPEFLRQRYNSGDFEIFELPYCSRCPKVIVDAVGAFILKILELGGLEGRLDKHYLPFTQGNDQINELYPKIKTITVSVISTIAKYIELEVLKIPITEIIESNTADNKYPTVLIIGQKHYLTELHKKLIKKYPNIAFESRSEEDNSKVLEAFKILLKDENSNLGWRIITDELQSALTLKAAVLKAQTTTPFREVLTTDFVENIASIIEIIKIVKKEAREFSMAEKTIIRTSLNEQTDILLNYFTPIIKVEPVEQDPEIPTILLRTFEGSKGLSGGHVFIVGANDGSIPKIESDQTIKDIECCKFIVALTRTRKQCHIISNRWLASPMDKKGNWNTTFTKSQFIGLIPPEYTLDLGYKKSVKIK